MADLIKISDSTSTTSSVVAASSTAVKAAMDKANSAATAASNAQTTADSKLSSITAGTGITVSGSTVGLATVVTAGTAGPTANATPGYGSTFTVPKVTYDAYGRVTGHTNYTVKIPAAPSSVSTATTATKATAIPNVTAGRASGKFTLPSGGTWRWLKWYTGNDDFDTGTASGGSVINITTSSAWQWYFAIRIA